MAGARLEKVGTIFARLNSLLKKNVMSVMDKPVWYEIYALHPPHSEPRYDQKANPHEVRDILYEEDLIRAKYHDQVKFYEALNLSDQNYESQTKQFIKIYAHLKAQGPLDDEKVFEVALEQLKAAKQDVTHELIDQIDEPTDFGIVKSFTKGMTEAKVNKTDETSTPKKSTDSPIDIKTLF